LKLKDRNLDYLTLLRSRHSLNLSMSDSTDAKRQDPTAVFELALGIPDYSVIKSSGIVHILLLANDSLYV
jgi:hypothetical protein